MSTKWLVVATAALAACGKEPSVPSTAVTPASRFEAASIARGAVLYEEHCAQCHGPQAQGHPDWQMPSDGSFAAAPPLNGSGNDWKRSRAQLLAVIRDGVKRPDGVVVMPGWEQRLNARDIEDVVAWFQSLWSPQVYESWYKANLGATKG
jgi:mono/diheme cytochrome c family protein